jgi:hypothetical protein
MSAVMEAAMVEAAMVTAVPAVPAVAVTVAMTGEDRYSSWLSCPGNIAWRTHPCICSLSKQAQSGDRRACNQKISNRHFRTYLFYRVCDPFPGHVPAT